VPEHACPAAAGSYVGGAASLFGVNGARVNEATAVSFAGFVVAFAAWIQKNLRE
jgi:hypothetical protein